MKPTFLSQGSDRILKGFEGDAIEAVVLGILIHEKDMRDAVFGLYGQKTAEKPDLIRVSIIANTSIDYSPQKERVDKAIESASLYLDVGSKIYEHSDGGLIMILEADFGRFICAFAQKLPNPALETLVYMSVARALTELHPEDTVLAASRDHIYFANEDDFPSLGSIDDYVVDLFTKGEPRKVAAWHHWYKNLAEARPLPKLFI